MNESYPRPGGHLPPHRSVSVGSAPAAPKPGPAIESGAEQVDPATVIADVAAAVAEADAAAALPTGEGTADPHGLVALTRRGRILEQAHQSLVDALAAVDKN